MTKEEELDWLCRLRSEIYVYMPKEWLIPMNNALDMAISALSENKREFDGMNNGEVMNLVLRKVFPRTIFIRGVDEYHKSKSIVYSEEWENAPYQKGGDDET